MVLEHRWGISRMFFGLGIVFTFFDPAVQMVMIQKEEIQDKERALHMQKA